MPKTGVQTPRAPLENLGAHKLLLLQQHQTLNLLLGPERLLLQRTQMVRFRRHKSLQSCNCPVTT